MPSTYAQQKSALDAIALTITRARTELAKVASDAAGAEASLNALQTQYSGIVTDINAALTASPNDEAIKTLKAEKDLLVTEFQALKATAGQIKDAINAIPVS